MFPTNTFSLLLSGSDGPSRIDELSTMPMALFPGPENPLSALHGAVRTTRALMDLIHRMAQGLGWPMILVLFLLPSVGF